MGSKERERIRVSFIALRQIPIRMFDKIVSCIQSFLFTAFVVASSRGPSSAGFKYSDISLSTQEFPDFFPELVEQGLSVNACSLSQLEAFGKAFPGADVGLRFNPGLGSGGTGKTNVGGPSSSFGIWHELLPQVKALVEQYDLKPVRVHTHIGSGSDPAVWMKVSGMSLDLCREFPSVTVLNLGGGYKVGRMAYEKSTDLEVVGTPVKKAFEDFAKETGRELKLEIEPGTFLLANSCAVVCSVQDMVETRGTGENVGHTFIKLDAGMTEVLRPSLYAAQVRESGGYEGRPGPEGMGGEGDWLVSHQTFFFDFFLFFYFFFPHSFSFRWTTADT